MPYLTPDSAPGGTICRTLVIPDDPNWKAIVNGALSELIYAHRFEQFGTATPDEVAAVFQQMFYDYLESECAVSAIYPGEIRTFAFSAVPASWLRCEAQSLLRADYPDLFTAIGTTFGAADGTHFTLPDLRGRFVAGYWSNPPVSGAYNVGVMGGEEGHFLTEAEMPAHTHTEHVQNAAGAAGSGWVQSARTEQGTPRSTGATGGGQAHENRPPFTVLVYAIYTGV